jgi:hypothetical protein
MCPKTPPPSRPPPSSLASAPHGHITGPGTEQPQQETPRDRARTLRPRRCRPDPTRNPPSRPRPHRRGLAPRARACHLTPAQTQRVCSFPSYLVHPSAKPGAPLTSITYERRRSPATTAHSQAHLHISRQCARRCLAARGWKAIARLRQPERSRLGEGESCQTLLRATAQGYAGLSFSDASLPESRRRRRLEFGEDDGPGRRRLARRLLCPRTR